MRYFERAELARRYHLYRPRVHDEVIQEIAESRPALSLNAVLDVACGTGQSTEALTTFAPVVCGCDVSAAMVSIARREVSTACFLRAAADVLPFSNRTFDLVSVSMAFHWFDQSRFLAEAARVLAQGGELWVYTLYFPGVLLGDETFSTWHRERHLAEFPVPARHWDTLCELLQGGEFSLVFAGRRELSYEVNFTSTELRNYLTTSSNIEAALRAGANLREVDAWFDNELASFFRDNASHRFAYIGFAEIAVAA